MRILIRADGDRLVGTGHVMRTLALAERARVDGHDVTLLGARLDDALADRVQSTGVALAREDVEPASAQDLAWVAARAAARAADWIVTDGYRFDAAYQEALRAAGFRVLCIDDHGRCEPYAAHVVLNQNVGATEASYRRRSGDTRLLLGPRYAMLRAGFAAAAAHAPRIAERAARVLVTLGGADPGNATARVLAALALVPGTDLRVRVVVGPCNPHRRHLAALATDPRVEIAPPVEDLAPTMRWADLAIAAAGTTAYELCCMGVPTLFVSIAESQRDLARALEDGCLGVDLGWHETLEPATVARTIAAVRNDHARRTDLSRRGRAAVDGRGAARVLDALVPQPAA
jgi:UDP-2,4-diacetamido-2,4,6-trideoxy-beta-L-altropyranose hydrolase